MTEAVTLTNEELAILCDIVAGWSVEHSENLNLERGSGHFQALTSGSLVEDGLYGEYR